MKKLWTSLLISLVLFSCAHKPLFDYEITRPKCENTDFVKWCWTGLDGDEEYVAVYAGEPCPDESIVMSLEIEIDCFRKLDHYIGELEIRNEICNKQRIDKRYNSPYPDP